MDKSRRGTLKALAKSFVRENTHGEKVNYHRGQQISLKARALGLFSSSVGSLELGIHVLPVSIPVEHLAV
jgi:hypothetical protein